jgi:hypothetical protein
LFNAVIDKARDSSTENILNAVRTFSQEALNEFLNKEYSDVSVRYKAYLQRRKDGHPRELFPDFDYAKYWLRTAAPVKYVDGAWLGGIYRITSDLVHRSSTKTAWQILSEELGDGDLRKNHVWVYQQLLKSIDADDIGTGDSKEFISSSQNMNNDARVWTAATAQLCISLFPESFLPEILGFNMSYESLPLHLLITIYELRELNIDPYYFVLHVSIDNKHSGHAAMGVDAVTTYMKSLPVEEQDMAWKRVQAGFLLASELATTPTPRSDLDTSLEKIFGEKTTAAYPIHAACSAKIGGRTGKKLCDWLDPTIYPMHSLAFLRALADSRWIVRGKPEKSQLVYETKWGGRMFGAFTIKEVNVLEAWICQLTQFDRPMNRSKSYEIFTGVKTKSPNIDLTREFDHILARPSAPRCQIIDFESILSSSSSSLSLENKIHAILSLLSISAVPFEYLPSLPAKCASTYGMMALKCLRALYDFLPESDVCAGMDEVISNTPSMGVMEIARISLNDINQYVRPFVGQILCISAHPEQNAAILVGLQDGFIEYVFAACEQLNAVTPAELKKLHEIGERCRNAIDDFVKEKNECNQWSAEMDKGKKAIRRMVSNIIN